MRSVDIGWSYEWDKGAYTGCVCLGVPVNLCCAARCVPVFAHWSALALYTSTSTSACACDSSTPALAYPRHFLLHIQTQALLSSYTCAHLRTSPFATIPLPSLSPLCPTSLTSIAFCLHSSSHSSVIFLIHSSITWLRQFDNQSQPRRAFPAIILLPGLHPLLIPPLPLILEPLYLAASPPGAVRDPLHPFLPVRIIMPVYPMVLRPPPLLRLHPSPLLVLQRPPLARITSLSSRISPATLCVSCSILRSP
jgi:hypothetical protein